MNPELLDIAGGDTYRARAIHKLLTTIADGPDPALREMASGVLKGDLDLREAADSQIYGDAIAHSFGTFWQRYQDLDPEEQQALLAEGHQFIEQQATSETEQ
jgi:hypothetical protein